MKTRHALAGLVLAVLAQAPDVLAGAIYWVHDLRHHHHPWRHWAAERWASGELPLWAADVGGGFPLMADGQTGVFYPPNVLLGALLPSEHALSVGILLHTLLAALGAFWMCRRLGRSVEASLFGGLGFALSGFLVAHTTYAGMLSVASWAPIAVGLAWELRSLRAAACFAGVTAAVLTAGHPQGAVLVLALAGLVFLYRAPWKLHLGAGGFLGGLLIASPQVLATWELVRTSAREGGVDAAFGSIGSLPPWEAVNAVLPRFWGWERPADIPLTYVHKGAAYFGTGENHWEDCFYLGLPLVVLAGLALVARGPRFWKGVLVGSFVLMLGKYGLVWLALRQLPVFDHFRFPVRFALVFTLAAVVLATGALDRIDGARLRRGALALLALVVLAALGGLGAATALAGPLAGALGPERFEALLAGMRWNATWGLALPAAVLLAVALCGRSKRPAVALSVVLLLDLSASLGGYNPRLPASAADPPPGIEALREGRIATVDRVQPTELDKRLVASSLGLLWGLSDVIVLSPLLLPDHEEALAAGGLDVGREHGAVKARQVEDRLDVASTFSVRWLLSVHALEHPDLRLAHDDGVVRVYENLAVLDRARMEGDHLVEWLEDHDERVRLRVTARQPGRLVLADTWYPGWIATVDGEEVPIERVAPDHRAVALDAGIHEVVFAYRPWWRPLAWCSLGWFVVLGVAVWRRRTTPVSRSGDTEPVE